MNGRHEERPERHRREGEPEFVGTNLGGLSKAKKGKVKRG